MNSSSRVLPSVGRVSWRETLALLVASWLVPFLVHFIPSYGPREIGVYLIPAFWAAFVAVYLGGALLGSAVALVTPVINLLLTGLPALPWVGTMSMELVAFALFTAVLVRRWPTVWLIAPLGYIPAKALTIAIQWAVPVFDYHRPPLAHLLGSTQNALPGLAVLLAINFALVKLAPRDLDWDHE